MCLSIDVRNTFCARCLPPRYPGRPQCTPHQNLDKPNPHISSNHRLIDTISHCFILGYRGRKRNAYLSPRRPSHARLRPHHGPPKTDLLSVALLASTASANATSSIALPFWNVRPRSLVEKHTLKYQSLSFNVSPSDVSHVSLPLSPCSQYPVAFCSQATSTTPRLVKRPIMVRVRSRLIS